MNFYVQCNLQKPNCAGQKSLHIYECPTLFHPMDVFCLVINFINKQKDMTIDSLI